MNASLTLLSKMAHCVQLRAGKDLRAFMSSGFHPRSTNRAQAPLEMPVIRKVENIVSTKLRVHLNRVTNAR